MLDPNVHRVLEGTSIAHLATVLPGGSPDTVPLWMTPAFRRPSTVKAWRAENGVLAAAVSHDERRSVRNCRAATIFGEVVVECAVSKLAVPLVAASVAPPSHRWLPPFDGSRPGAAGK